MGSFWGHALPGTFLLTFGIWMAFRILHAHYSKLYLGSAAKHFSTSKYRCLEGVFKVIFTTVGFIGEIITGFNGGKFVYIGNGQHATMFFFFGFSGVMDVMTHYKAPLPPGSDSVALVLAFIVEAILFNFHLHGRTDLDVVIHTLLLYVVCATVVCLIVEMAVPKQTVLVKLAPVFFVLLQGSWFWHIGFILYTPLPSPAGKPWQPQSHVDVMLATMLFIWHMAAISVSLTTAAMLMSWRLRRKWRGERGNDPAEMKPLNLSAAAALDDNDGNDALPHDV